ncbi:hypothetical protein VTN00DRAFT_5645 [Thermoascus crustaceus]|uniref:uncharacterized protein n=1 Tax=Thermoascus crustaceus TaxID=5088 RepID=UPI003743BD51
MTTNLSRRLIAFKADSSLAPFLYQTRTLTAPPSYLYRRAVRSQRRTYAAENTSSNENTSDGAPNEDSQAALDAEQNKSSTTSTSDAPSASTTSSDAPKPPNYLKKRAAAITSSRETSQKDTPPTKLRTSMTRDEREAFNQLLDRLGTHLPSQTQESLEKSGLLKDHLKRDKIVPSQENRRKPAQEPKEQSEISAIFNEAMEDVKAGRHEENSTPAKDAKNKRLFPKMGRARSTLEVERERVSRIIERIRRFKYSDVDISDRAKEPMPMERIIEIVVRKESQKIEAALQSAIDEGKGDIGLWEVCKERVFDIIQHLKEDDALKWEQHLSVTRNAGAGSSGGQESQDINAAANTPEPAMTTSQPKESEDAGSSPPKSTEPPATDDADNKELKTSPDTPSAVLEIPPFVPTYPVVSILYPEMILSAFRLLNTHFPNSPIISQILPTIKSHGRRAVILGASTSLYNELLYYYWSTHDDLPTVVSLLQEMHVTGVDPDHQTYELVKCMIQQHQRELRAYRRRMQKKHGKRKMRKMMKQQDDDALWMDTKPNEDAFRELVGQDGEPGWIQRLGARLREIDERGQMGEHHVPIRTMEIGGFEYDRVSEEKEAEVGGR